MREQIHSIAESVAKAGAKNHACRRIQAAYVSLCVSGHGEKGLELMREAADKFGLFTVSEVMDPSQVEMMGHYVDIYQVGARNMQNYHLLRGARRSSQASAAQTRSFRNHGRTVAIRRIHSCRRKLQT